MAVTSGGMSMWEMALFCIPQLVIASSDREIEYTDYLAELKYIEKLANYSSLPEPSKIASKIEDLIMNGSLDKLNLENFSNALDPDGIKSTVSVLLTKSSTGGKLR
jgi:spore coat polysaccharide biosynthesis predicted glycosyltransferase SpsG